MSFDIVYKDDNKKNKEKSNLKTLCANCNRVYQKKLKEKQKKVIMVIFEINSIISLSKTESSYVLLAILSTFFLPILFPTLN